MLTGADVRNMPGVACQAPMQTCGRQDDAAAEWPLLCEEKVLHVGDAVAMVIADSLARARDAAEAIRIDYEPLPVATTVADALKPKAATVWEAAPGNIAFDQTLGNKDKTDAAFAKAHKVVSLTVDNNRLITNYMETRAAIGEYDGKTKRYTLTLGSQGVHGIQDSVAKILGVKDRQAEGSDAGRRRRLRHQELQLPGIPACASGRAQAGPAGEVDAGPHGAFPVLRARPGQPDDGRNGAGRPRPVPGTEGAYQGQSRRLSLSVRPLHPLARRDDGHRPLRHPHDVRTLPGVYTHTVPVDAYRGAGRPEAAYLLERLVDSCAREMGIAPETIRARNFVKATAMPYKTQTKRTYDVGEFEGHMRAALEKADRKGFPPAPRLEEGREDPRLRIRVLHRMHRLGIGRGRVGVAGQGRPRDAADRHAVERPGAPDGLCASGESGGSTSDPA